MIDSGAISVKSLADHVFERVLDAIVKGTIKPGDRLSETLIAKQLGVSRGPLREAIRRLEGRKLVERTPNVGPRVVSLTPDDLIEIFYIRERLEGLAAKLATERMSEAALDQLDERLEQHTKNASLQRGDGYLQNAGNDDFHYLIVQGSGSKRLKELLCNDLYHLLRIYRFKSSETVGRANAALREHKAILGAMRKRDAADAERLMMQHIAAARDNLAKSVAANRTDSAA
jgi:DNA-binding GntR family transcriptional regulator